MKDKKRIIILGALAIISFAASYLVSGWLGGEEPKPSPQPSDGQAPPDQMVIGAPPAPGSIQPITIIMKERELDRLAKELRLEISTFRDKKKQQEKQQERIKETEKLLAEQVKELEGLQMKLAAPLARLRDAKGDLENTRVRIKEQEKSNLKRTATIYEKMDAAKGSGILIAMYKNNQEDDVVKILFYMSEKKAAKLLAEIPDPKVAADLCQKMKKIQEDG